MRTLRAYVHHAVPFAFNAIAPKPKRWLRFLGELWGSDTDSIEALQEVFGYALSGDTRQQKMFLLVGPKRGGKGTIARVLKRLIGVHNVAGPTLASFATNFGLQDLVAKSLAVISDARLSNKTDHSIVAERLLSITGEDTLTVDRKYLPHWTGQLPTRILMQRTNCRASATPLVRVMAERLTTRADNFKDEWVKADGGLERLERILKMRDREARAAADKATKLRLTNQSRYTPHGAARGACSTGQAPWESASEYWARIGRDRAEEA